MARRPLDWVPPDVRRQAGLFSVAQAQAAGATPAETRWRRERGHWVRYAGDAYALPELRRSAHADAVAAMLTWPDAVVCLATAARVHGLPVADDGRVHVLVPHKRGARARLQPHRFPVRPADVVRRGPVLLTSRRRTVVDCLGRLDPDAADALFAWVATRDVLSADDLEQYLVDRRGAWGNDRRRRALTDLADGVASVAERRLHRTLRAARITGWAADQRVYDDDGLIGRVDVLFRAERLVIEVDGYAFHAGRDRFRADRRRQNRLVSAGWTVLRFTWEDLTTRPDRVVTEVRATLDRLRRTAQ